MSINYKQAIKKILNKHPRLDSIQYCVRHSKEDEYRLKMLELDPTIMQCVSMGELNRDKNIYFIEFGDELDGFFAEYRKLLDYLYFADRFGFTPVVKFTDKFLYSEKSPINGSENPFEYYFKQPSKVTVEDAYNSYNVFRCSMAQVNLIEHDKPSRDGYALSEEYFDNLARIARNYIKLNDIVKIQIEKSIAEILLNKKIIGVHVRGTDFKKGFNGHPTIVTPDMHLKRVKELLKTGLYEGVFLATDDINAINLFKNELGDKVLFYSDVLRSSDDVSVAFKVSNRENHHYNLGLEVLRDMLTLASCDALVAGKSQVSICAIITKKSWNQEYIDYSILDNGINHTKKNFIEVYK